MNDDNKFDGRGQITRSSSDHARQRWHYTYDGLDRLVLANNTGDNALDQSFAFDNAGNMTSNSALGTYVYQAGTAARPHAPLSVAGEVPI